MLHLFLISKNQNISFRHYHRRYFSSVSTTSASQAKNPTVRPPHTESLSNSLAHFLITSCGFSSHKAASATKRIAKAVSVEQANSVRHFFKHLLGFTDASIRKLITNESRILSVDIETTLRPNLQSLYKMGFTTSELEILIASNPYVLISRLGVPRLKFWQTFLRSNSNKELVSFVKRNRGLINQDIASGIAPKLSLLQEHGLPEKHIIGLVKRGSGFIGRSPDAIVVLLERAKELGFDLKSPMCVHALSTLSYMDSCSFEAKTEFFKGFGWSDKEVFDAFKKAPALFHLADENLRAKMEFLVGRAGCQQSYIASNPLLLMFSMDKRLKPRCYMMEILKSNGIVCKLGLYSVLTLPDNKFVESMILPYREQVANIDKIYDAACAGKIGI